MKSVANKTVTRVVNAELNESGMFSFSKEMLKHIGQGIHLVNLKSKVSDPQVLLSLLGLITEALYAEDADLEFAQREFTREEIHFIRKAILAKLEHCEKQKQVEDADENTTAKTFNENSYINMKLLLIDLGEWLSVSI